MGRPASEIAIVLLSYVLDRGLDRRRRHQNESSLVGEMFW